MYANHVSLNGPFNWEHTASNPAGNDLLETLTSELKTSDLQIRDFYSTDHSHAIYVVFKKACIRPEVGAIGDDNAQ